METISANRRLFIEPRCSFSPEHNINYAVISNQATPGLPAPAWLCRELLQVGVTDTAAGTGAG